jgi:glucose/arabinose dehydrogenase
MKHNRNIYITSFLFLFLKTGCLTTFSQPVLNYKQVITSLTSPVDIVNANDGSKRLFVVQQNGIIKVFDSLFNYKSDFITVPGVLTGGERGLLSMAFHPDYRNNGFFFVYYTNSSGSIEIARLKVSTDPNTADAGSKLVIITIPHPGQANHNGGKLNFGRDGYLYFGTGDGGSGGDPPNNAQTGISLLGKMLRIDIDHIAGTSNYSIPADNPYINDPLIADEVWAMGLRNPWRWSFDRITGDMWIGDVGQNAWEEINFSKANETKGVNYGWRCYEGTHAYNTTGCKTPENYVPPVFDYPHNAAAGGFVVTGGYVYRGTEYPSLNGYYICADYASANQWMISDSANTWVVKKQAGTFPAAISSFGEGEDGTLYACSLSAGIIYKIEAITDVQFQLLTFTGEVKNNIATIKWSASGEQNLQQFELEASNDSINFQKIGTLAAQNQINSNFYSFDDNVKGVQKRFYRLRIINNDEKWDHSKTIVVVNNSAGNNFIFPSLISDHIIHCFIADSYDYLEVFGMNGSLMEKRNISGISGKLDIPISSLAKGIYIVRLSKNNNHLFQKVFVY